MSQELVPAIAFLAGFERTTWRMCDVGDRVVTLDDRGLSSAVGTLTATSYADGANGPTVNVLVRFSETNNWARVFPADGRVWRKAVAPAATARIRAAIERQHDVPVPPWWTAAGQARRADDRTARRIDAGRFPVISWGHGVAVLLGAAVVGGIILAGAAIALAFIV